MGVVTLLMLILGHGEVARAAHIVVVKASDAEPYQQVEAALRARLIEHKDEVRTLLLKDVAEKGTAATIGQPDAVVAVGTAAARWLHKQLPPGIRLVYGMVTNADEAGLLAGNDAWGVTTEVAASEQIKLMAEALPRARAIGVLFRSDTAEGKRGVEALRSSLPQGWRVEAVAVNDFPSVAAAIDTLTQKNVDVIWTTPDQKLFDTASVRALLLAALRTKIPVWGFSPAFVRAGALLGVGVEPRAQGNQLAEVALRVIAGQAQKSDKGQTAREFQIAVNLIVARQLGVEIPETLSGRATFVFRPEK